MTLWVSPRRVWPVAGLVLALACFAAVASADGPNDPEVTSTHTVSKDGTTVEFCITVNSDRLDGKIFDIEFLGSWAPGVNAPENKFVAPTGWSWEPVGSGGWRAYNGTTPMAKGQKYCFTLPLAPGQTPPDPVNLIATDQAHHPIHNFLSTLAPPPAENGIKHAFWLGPTPDKGEGLFTSTYTGCSGTQELLYNATVTLRTPSPGVIVFHEGQFGSTSKGRVYRNRVVHMRGSRSGFDGAIKGKKVTGEYRYTGSGCLKTFSASIDLDAPGKLVATCPHTTLAAPRRVRYGNGDLHLRLGLECDGEALAGQSLEVYLVAGKKKQKLGSFKTKRKQSGVLIHLGDARPNAILLRFGGNGFFARTTRLIPIAY